MRVLLIYCHPCPESFCAALRDAAVDALASAGHEVEVRSLYDENFNPVLCVAERAHYYDEGVSPADVSGHVASLKRADALVLVYPTWWFGLPAILKGWLDRVWLPGVAFRVGGARVLQPLLSNIRRITVVTTYGSPRWLLWLVGWPDWRLFRFGIRSLCNKSCRLEWIALPNMDTNTAAQRQRFIAKLRTHLSSW